MKMCEKGCKRPELYIGVLLALFLFNAPALGRVFLHSERVKKTLGWRINYGYIKKKKPTYRCVA